jgi:hypothetical protein
MNITDLKHALLQRQQGLGCNGFGGGYLGDSIPSPWDPAINTNPYPSYPPQGYPHTQFQPMMPQPMSPIWEPLQAARANLRYLILMDPEQEDLGRAYMVFRDNGMTQLAMIKSGLSLEEAKELRIARMVADKLCEQ